MPSVSVIVPTYNRPGYLTRALASIRAQTFWDYEIIVINDYGESVEQLCRLFDPVTHYRLDPNRGLPAARNIGIKLFAKGRYIAYLDDDDVWLPQHLEKLVKFRQQTDCKVVYSDSYFWQDEKKFELLLSEKYKRKHLQQRNLSPICSILHDKDLFDLAGYFDESLPALEDYDLWLRFSEHTDFEHLPEVTALYSKRNGSNQMSAENRMMAETIQFVKQRHKERVTA